MDQYTHIIKFEIDGSFIRGEAEFDTDGKASFRMDEWSEPISLVIIQKFEHIMAKIKELYDEDIEVKKIVIKKK